MIEISRQMAVGAVVAAFLALGASASPDSGTPVGQSEMLRGEPNIGVLQRIAVASKPIASLAMRICASAPQSGAREEEHYAVLTTVLRSCGDKALDVVLDVVAEVGARLK